MVTCIYHSQEWRDYVASGWITHTVGPINSSNKQIALMVWNGKYVN